jgi:NitT/TauT family transport system ATP-binding protein
MAVMQGKAKIQLIGVGKVYTSARNGRHEAVVGVDLEVYEGEFLCLLGPSGCGKTTLLSLMAGFEAPTEGEVRIDGVPVRGPDPRYVTIFQEYGLFPWRTVLGNVEYGLEVRGVPTGERRRRAMHYIRAVGLEDFVDFHPHELSGGMQQRVALARALAVEPEIIFMDEPFGALDALTRYRLQEEVSRIWEERRPTIVLVTHDVEEAVFLADRIVVMSGCPGRIREIVPVGLGRPRERAGNEAANIKRKVLRALGLDREVLLEYYL